MYKEKEITTRITITLINTNEALETTQRSCFQAYSSFSFLYTHAFPSFLPCVRSSGAFYICKCETPCLFSFSFFVPNKFLTLAALYEPEVRVKWRWTYRRAWNP